MTAPAAPRSALVLKIDTLGDLVLFAPALRALREAWPATRLVVLIREAYADLAVLLEPRVEWLTTGIDPFTQGPQDAAAELARLREAVAALAPEAIAAATSRRNWLDAALAASRPEARRVALGTAETDPFFTAQLRSLHQLDAAAAFGEHVGFTGEEPDWRRNFHLIDALLGRAVPRTPPTLVPPATVREQASVALRERGLKPGAFVACAAAGFANVAIKTWPAENFGAAARHLRERHGLPVLLVGHEGERAHLESVRAHASGASVWLGRPGEIGLLAALIADSTLFLGNDTGAMHLAAALDVPVVGVFGGGTWPRFVPAARHGLSVVQPLPCFGCGWDCAFGDAPCIKTLPVDAVTGALDTALARRGETSSETRTVEQFPAAIRELMGATAARYRAFQADHLARHLQLEEKEREIHSLKSACTDRENVIRLQKVHTDGLEQQVAALRSQHVLLQQTLDSLPREAAASARALNDQAVHIRNLDALIQLRDREIAELKASAANHAAGLHELELAKHYGRLLAEKEAQLQAERRARSLGIAQAAPVPPTVRKLWHGARNRLWQPVSAWMFRKVVEEYWMQIGVLRHYEPRPLRWDDRIPAPRLPETQLPQIGLVTPSYGQEKFIERTMLSALDQHYARLLYVVQDGGSKDRSAEIIARHAARLCHWESARDKGQADAIHRGFRKLLPSLQPEDLMAWLNSDDLLAPGTLRFVAEYFATHPDVDVIYGHRIIIDDDDRDVGRWIMPRHDPATLEWIDYVPQETLFWRKRAWDLAGGIDPSFQFALDWDLLARFQQAGARVVRVPYFLGAFRVHAEQKTSQAIHTTGADEMRRIRTRFHGERQDDFATIDRHARAARFWGAITARLHEVGIRW